MVIVNVGHPEGNDDLERALSSTMASVFPTVMRDPAESTNSLLAASEAPISKDQPAAAITRSRGGSERSVKDANRLAPGLTGGAVYTDDKAPVEWLIDKSILDYAETQ